VARSITTVRTRVFVNKAKIAALNTRGGMIGRWADQFMREAVVASKIVMLNKPIPPKGPWARSNNLAASIRGDRQGSNQAGINMALEADTTYAAYVHEGTSTPIFSRSGNRMPVGNTQGDIVAWKNPVAGQDAYPFLRMGMNVVLVRHQLRPIRE
jgi:hypothetical protein